MCGLITREQYIQPGADQKLWYVKGYRFRVGRKQSASQSGQYKAGFSGRQQIIINEVTFGRSKYTRKGITMENAQKCQLWQNKTSHLAMFAQCLTSSRN